MKKMRQKKDNNDDNCEIGFGGIQLERFETKEPLRCLKGQLHDQKCQILQLTKK